MIEQQQKMEKFLKYVAYPDVGQEKKKKRKKINEKK